MWGWLCGMLGGWLVRYLERPVRCYTPFSVSDPVILQRVLRPGDILLVEGRERISVAIKYLTQSTWSHAALYVGDAADSRCERGEKTTLIEANLANGVVAVPLSKYRRYNTRICRPIGLTKDDRARLVAFAIGAIGTRYDLRNVIDLARYLLPTPPVPVRWHRRMLAFGSGDPTRAICSTLIAQAFQSIQYPILPRVEKTGASDGALASEILHLRHHSLFAPRDFDLSPYFQVIKPTIELNFDYRDLTWDGNRPRPAAEDPAIMISTRRGRLHAASQN
jgi:hypothetical protein